MKLPRFRTRCLGCVELHNGQSYSREKLLIPLLLHNYTLEVCGYPVSHKMVMIITKTTIQLWFCININCLVDFSLHGWMYYVCVRTMCVV